MKASESAVRYRCNACGNRTRFDVIESRRSRRFEHFTLAGEMNIEEEEVLSLDVEKVVCRWCGSSTQVETVEAADSTG